MVIGTGASSQRRIILMRSDTHYNIFRKVTTVSYSSFPPFLVKRRVLHCDRRLSRTL